MITRTALAASAALALALPSPAGAIDFAGTTADYSAPVVKTDASLVAEDVNGEQDYYARIGGQPKLLTSGRGADKTQYLVRASGNGSIAYFRTSDALVKEDTDTENDLYLRRPSGISIVTPDAAVKLVGMTADGATAYLTTAAPLTGADFDGKIDVYTHVTATGELSLITTQTSHDVEFETTTSAGGVVFTTGEPLDAEDTDFWPDVYLQMPGGKPAVLSAGDASGQPAHFEMINSADGRILFSTAEAILPADTDDETDVYEAGGGFLELRTPSSSNLHDATFVAASSGDLHRVLFSTPEKLVAADTDDEVDYYAHDNGILTLLTPGTTDAVDVVLEDVSADAEVMLFSAKDQLLATDTDDRMDMYRTGDTGLVHVSKTNGPYDEFSGALSANGVLTAWQTAEPISALDTDTVTDAYIRSKFGNELASRRDAGAIGGGTDHHAEVRDFVGTGELIIETPERLLADDRNDISDVYSRGPSTLAMLTRDDSAPDTTAVAPAQVGAGEPFAVTVDSTEPGAIECRLDGGDWVSCAGWQAGGLTAGQHLVEVRATDLALNVDATPATVTVTAAAPQQTTEKPPVTETEKPPVKTEIPDLPFPPEADKIAPALSKARVQVRRRVPTLTYSLSEAATIRVTVQRRSGGRWKTLRTKILQGKPGANRAALSKLPRRGTFRVTLVATDAAQNASARLVLRPKGR